MNQYFYETRGKEKVKGLLEEGMRGQALRRSKDVKTGLFRGSLKFAVALLGILSLLGFLVR
jgi:hypothetical protein